MDFGFVFMGDCHIHSDVKFAEDHGFSHAWLYDSQMLGSEVYAALALCADRTEKIKIGPGVAKIFGTALANSLRSQNVYASR